MSRIRSPNYPAMSLSNALERIRQIHKAEGRNVVAREAIAKAIGFSSLNGASATSLSALAKFGLLEAAGDGEARVSELSMRILHPESEQERAQAVAEAAFKPALFADIKEKWPDRAPSDDSLRSFLVRRGFSAGALEQVIQFYRDTLDMVEPSVSEQVPPATSEGRAAMSASTANTPHAGISPPPSPLNGKPFTIGFDGTMLTGIIAIKTVKDIDRLMRVLQAQKAAFEAMQDGENEDNDSLLEELETIAHRPDPEVDSLS